MGLRQVEQGLSLFFAKCFGIFDDFSKWGAPNVLRNLEKSSNMPKKIRQKLSVEEPCSACLKPVSQKISSEISNLVKNFEILNFLTVFLRQILINSQQLSHLFAYLVMADKTIVHPKICH